MNLVSLWLGVADIPIFKTMRTLRGLRPLRAMSRIQSMKVRGPIDDNTEDFLIS